MSILGLNSELSISRTNLFFFESESNSGDVSSRFFPCEAGVIGAGVRLITFGHQLYQENVTRRCLKLVRKEC